MAQQWTIRINRYQLRCLDGDVSGKQQLLDILRIAGPGAYSMEQVLLAAGLMDRVYHQPEVAGEIKVDRAEMDFIRERVVNFRFSMADPALLDLIRDILPEQPDGATPAQKATDDPQG